MAGCFARDEGTEQVVYITMSYLMSIAFRIFEVAGESGERVE
jgi:hypothetical protein